MKSTISIKRETHRIAKEYAQKTGRTFSGLIELSLNKMMAEEIEND